MKHLLNICNINGAEVEPVDIITFGSPCQDLSVAGKREGMKHAEQGDEETTRSGLFYEAIRIIEEKPVKLYEWLLTNYAKQGDKILDTHLGSGSSRIAAYNLGFDFVGCEIDEDYFKAQEERFARHTAQQSLFIGDEK